MAAPALNVTPEYLAETQQPLLYGIAAVFIILVTLVVALRFVSRRIGKIAWKWDDFLILLAYTFFIILTGMCIGDAQYGGVGRHEAWWILTDPETLTTFLKFFIAIPLVYLFAVILPKLALLSIYLDIFVQKPLRIMCYVCAGIMIGNWFANTIAGFKSCTPFDYIWNQISAPGTGTCFDVNSWFRWASLANIVTDVVMLVLPIPMLLQLQVPTSVRIGVAVTFLLGSSGIIASIFRFAFFYQTNAISDPTWSAVILLIWTIMEVGMYVIAASLPAYRPLLRFLGVKIKLTRVGKTSRRSEGNTGPRSSSTDRVYRSDGKFSRLDEENDQTGQNGIALPEVDSKYQHTVSVHATSTNDSSSRNLHQLDEGDYDYVNEYQQQQVIPNNRIGVKNDITLQKS